MHPPRFFYGARVRQDFFLSSLVISLLSSIAVVVSALAESLGKPFPWAVGFFFGNTELGLELWNVIAGISGFDD